MRRKTPLGLALAATMLSAVLTGCGETADAIHDAADAATGNQAVQMGEGLKQQLDGIQQRQLEKLDR
ncbi:MAG: hypothetical protein AAF488_06950 [Planctomycetota bacterium]